MEKKGFLYADKEQQLIRANGFMVLSNTAYYIYIMIMLLVSFLRGERSGGFCGLIGVLVFISLAATWIAFLRNRKANE